MWLASELRRRLADVADCSFRRLLVDDRKGTRWNREPSTPAPEAAGGEWRTVAHPLLVRPGRHHQLSRRLTARRARVVYAPDCGVGVPVRPATCHAHRVCQRADDYSADVVQSRRHDLTESAGRGPAMARRHDLGRDVDDCGLLDRLAVR